MIDRTDEETGELVRAWLQRYGLSIIAGIVLAIAVIAGYEWWLNRQENLAGEASAKLIALNDAVANKKVTEAEALYGELDNKQLQPLAALLMAAAHSESGEQEKMLGYLNTAAGSDDVLVAQTANWQLARNYIAQEDYPAATKALQALKGSAYEQQIPLLRGVMEQKQGNRKAALESYQEALRHNPEQAGFIEAQIAAIQGEIIVDSAPEGQ